MLKAQAAIDFMMSYGIALIIILIAIAVIYKVTVLSPALAVSTCSAVPGFACEAYALNSSGILTLELAQATGGSLTIHGAACSSQPNATGNRPAYGNVWVTNTVGYYFGSNSPGTGIPVYSGAANTMVLYCYGGSGVASGPLGSGFSGFVWLNYTIPNYGNVTQQVASLNVRYT